MEILKSQISDISRPDFHFLPDSQIMSTSNQRSRWFFFTVNGVTEEMYDGMPHVISKAFSYLVYQLELGEDATLPHVQGTCYFKDAKTFSAAKAAIKSLFNREPHVEVCRDVEKSIEYCKKSDTRVGPTYEVRFSEHSAHLDEVRFPTCWTHGEAVTNDVLFEFYSPLLYALARSEHWPVHGGWPVLAWQIRSASPAIYFEDHSLGVPSDPS